MLRNGCARIFRYMVYCIVLLFIILKFSAPAFSYQATTNKPVEYYFSPDNQVTDKIINLINYANKSVYMLSYSFTSKDIADALINAHKRNVDVQIIIDGEQTDHYRTYADECMNAGIPVFLDTKYKIAHDKVLVIDSEIVETGSFNFTNAAERTNSENIVIIYSSDMAKGYKDRWDYRKKFTIPYK